MAGRAKDEVHSHFTTKDEKYEVEGCVKTHKVATCDHCGEPNDACSVASGIRVRVAAKCAVTHHGL
jgi:hypothetical protein